jgi:Na+/citrate or Na+/malate symporter
MPEINVIAVLLPAAAILIVFFIEAVRNESDNISDTDRKLDQAFNDGVSLGLLFGIGFILIALIILVIMNHWK